MDIIGTSLALMIAVAATPAAPAAPARFDLACFSVQEGAAAGRRVTSRIHVDLQAGRWCVDRCQGGLLPIARVTEDEIVFADERRASGMTDIRYDRRTGAYRHAVTVGDVLSMSMSGRCEIVPASRPGSPRQRS